jgi:hypothetical protein
MSGAGSATQRGSSGSAERAERLCLVATYCLRLSNIFHVQSEASNEPSKASRLNWPVSWLKPIVAPNDPSSQTVPLISVSRSRRISPVTTLPVTVSVTLAGRHRPRFGVAVPAHSPSYGPRAYELMDCDSNRVQTAVTTSKRSIPRKNSPADLSRSFMADTLPGTLSVPPEMVRRWLMGMPLPQLA